jgi:hypothetical protein
MIPRQQEHGAIGPLATLEKLQQPLPPGDVRAWIIEEIASAENGINRIILSDPKDTIHSLNSRPGELLFVFLRERGEPSPQVPIGRMQDL